MDFRTRSNFSKRRIQNVAFKIDQEVIIRVFIYTLISLLLLLVVAFFNIYFSYKARIISSVDEIPDEISSAVVIVDEISLTKTDELIVIIDDLKSMRAENKIDKFYFYVQKREGSFPNISTLEQRIDTVVADTEIIITTESTKSICGEILKNGVNKALIISPQSEIIFNVHTCNLSDMFAVAYYPNIKNLNFFNGYLNQFNQILTAPLE